MIAGMYELLETPSLKEKDSAKMSAALEPSSCKVLLVNIPALSAQLMATALTQQGMIEVMGLAQSPLVTKALVEQHAPQVVVVGSRSGIEQLTGMPYVEMIRAVAPQVRQIVLGQDLSHEEEIALLRAGARGLLCEARVTVPILSKCICSVAAGQIWANSEQLERLLGSLSRPRPLRVTNALGAAILSRREEEVLHLLAEGLSNRELAATLKLSEHTIKNHLFRIFDKLGVSSRMEAVLYALSRREQHVHSYPLAPVVLAMRQAPHPVSKAQLGLDR